MESPKVFISHSSEDKERFVVAFATRLREAGVDAWVDEWEIRPGDSFVDRIFTHGIGPADAFVVVISRVSVESQWVRDELDAATVKRIEEGARLVPVILDGVDDEHIPRSIRHLHQVRIKDPSAFDSEANLVIRTILGLEPPRPAIGPLPSYVQSDASIPGLQASDVVVLKTAGDSIRDTGFGFVTEPQRVWDTCHDLGIDWDGFVESVQFLEERGLVEEARVRDNTISLLIVSRAGIRAYYAARPADVDDVASRLAGAILNWGDQSADYRQLAEYLDVDPLLVVEIGEQLQDRRLLSVTKYAGGRIILSRPSPTLRRLAT